MNELIKHIQAKVSWCMIIAKGIVLVDKTKECVNLKLKIWMITPESRGLKSSRLKIKYIECKFCKNINVDDIVVELEDQVIPKKDQFKYIGSIKQKDEEINECNP